jgi:hypothetical protein
MYRFWRAAALVTLSMALVAPARAGTGETQGATPAAAVRRMPAVRAHDPGLAGALADGEARSPTFRRLLARIQQSDIIVHLERRPVGLRATGATQFVATVGGFRFVRVTLATRVFDDDAVALLGHELRHVVELADAPSVVDEPTYRGLYREIGYRSCDAGVCYDSRAAVRAGVQVLAELRHTGS